MKCFLYLAIVASPLALAQNLCDQYGYYASGSYYFNNNEWGESSGTGSGCLDVTSVSSSGTAFTVDWSWSGGSSQVKAYPFVGLTVSPQLISNIGSMPTTASWSYSGSSINADVSYDLFTASNPNHSTSSGDYELMIWLGKFGSIQPIGSSVGTVTVGGISWTLWYGSNGAQQTYSFVRSGGDVTSFSGDIMDFFDYLTQNKNFPASSQYLLTDEFGTEAFTGSNAVFTVSNWSASVNTGGGSRTTTSPPTKSTSPSSGGGGGTQTQWGQCGGQGYSGPTVCASPATCQTQNAYYAQCV